MKRIRVIVYCSMVILSASSCGSNVKKKISINDVARVKDPHSYSEPTKAVVTNLNLTLKVDFEKKRLEGTATWDYLASDSIVYMYFDVHNLVVEAVYNEMNAPIPFELGVNDHILGQSLKVGIGSHPKQINIKYFTTDSSLALQWLTPSQTAGKIMPFLYTQSEPVDARTWIPCQDSPGIRFTYKAKVFTPKGFMAIMSAKNPTEKNSGDGWYTFEQPNPIPSYLMALAVGDLGFKATGARSGVYAEPSVVEAAAWEFAETDKMMEVAEKLWGPYIWGRYDILVLPPSFPYGGMENPMLTFATPTVLAGDRSLASLIAHEMAHSWSGNLVTNATWNDFWLNEGFTMYLERRLMEEIHDTSYSDMLVCLGYSDLKATLEDMKEDSNDTKLKLSLDNRDPDEGMTDIAYEKGYLFLVNVENTVGRKKFDDFLKQYFEKYKFIPMTTERFIDELYTSLVAKGSEEDKKMAIRSWIYMPGLPAGFVEPTSSRFDIILKVADQYLKKQIKVNQIDALKWSSHEFMEFLRTIKKDVTLVQMAELDERFNFTESGNSEVLALWLEASIIHEYKVAYPALESFLSTVGRRKFLIVLYGAMLDNPNTEQMAVEYYKSNRKNYHSISTKSLDPRIYKVAH